MEMKYLSNSTGGLEFKVDAERNVGTIEGYASTFGNVDRGDDVVMRGAFRKSLESLRNSNKTMLAMLWQHETGGLMGGFPIDSMREDEKGLFVVGEVNLDTQKGKEAHALAKQGVLADFSIGYHITDSEINSDGIRVLKEVSLMEISLVTIPMNAEANVTMVKSVSEFSDLPVCGVSTKWNEDAAVKRVQELTGSQEEAQGEYRKAFLWHKSDDVSELDSYHLPIADVIDGKMVVVPRALSKAIVKIKGKGNVPDGVEDAIAEYYKKLPDLENPLEVGIGISEIKAGTPSLLRKMLQNGTKFSGAGAKFIEQLEKARRSDGMAGGESPDRGGRSSPDLSDDDAKVISEFINEFKSKIGG